MCPRTGFRGKGVDQRLAFLRDEGLVVSVLPVPPEETVPEVGGAYVLSVHGADRPGIVSTLTRVIADVGGNVTDLTTRLAGSLYVVVAELGLPADADVDQLTAKLAATAEDLGVGVSLRPADVDVL